MKKIILSLSFVVFSLTTFAQGPPPSDLPGSPGDSNDGQGVCDTPPCEAPIDNQIWLGLIGGVAIGGYLLMRKGTQNIA